MPTDANASFVQHEVDVTLIVTTTHEDVEACLTRSGIVAGNLIGEALVLSFMVHSPEVDTDDDDEAGT